MASASVGLIFMLSHFVLCLSAQGQQGHACPSSFHCGSLGVLSYPFTTHFQPSCGLCAINCTEPEKTIRIGRHGPWYNLNYSFSNEKAFLVDDWFLFHAVNPDMCNVFDKSFRLPRSPSVSFTVLLNETMWRCPNNTDSSPENKNNNTLRRIIQCGRFNVYHSYDSQFSLPKVTNCSLIQYPRVLVVEVTSECSRCITEAGHCEDLKNEEFKCISKKKGRKNLRQILGLGIFGGSIIFSVLGLVFWYIHKKIKLGSSTFASMNISADPTKTDLAMSKMYFSVPVFSYSELSKATNNFDPNMELGDGGFGTVYYGKLTDGREVAVKRLHERNYKQLQQFMNEIEIFTRLRHQNLVSFYGCTSWHSQELLLVYEYVPNGTIADHLYGDQAKCGILTWSVRMSIAIETARALSYLHASDIVHRDVKSKNILLDSKFGVKIADFGLSRLFPMNVTHISTIPQGTPGYLDPEYHQCYQLTDKSDVYSFGVVLIELISSMPPIDINRKEVNLSNYAMRKILAGAFDEVVDPRLGFRSSQKIKRMTTAVAELAFQCLQHDKEFRPAMADVLEALMSVETADYGEPKIEAKSVNDGILNEQTEADHVRLLGNTENLPSSKSVIHQWG